VINKALKTDIIKRLDILAKRFYTEIGIIKKEYNNLLMQTEVAVCLLAIDKAKINPRKKKYGIETQILEKANQIQRDMAKSTTPVSSIQKTKLKTTKKKSPPSKKFDVISTLTPTESAQADKMADVYYKFYLIENSLRKLIMRVLKHNYGEKWWDVSNVIPTGIQSTARKNITDEKAKKLPWHGKRGKNVHPIYYTYFGQLGDIIIKHWKAHFKDIIEDNRLFGLLISDLGLSRNIVMHCNPLAPQDIKSLDYYFEKLQLTLRNNLSKIPR